MLFPDELNAEVDVSLIDSIQDKEWCWNFPFRCLLLMVMMNGFFSFSSFSEGKKCFNTKKSLMQDFKLGRRLSWDLERKLRNLNIKTIWCSYESCINSSKLFSIHPIKLWISLCTTLNAQRTAKTSWISFFTDKWNLIKNFSGSSFIQPLVWVGWGSGLMAKACASYCFPHIW